jgi:hypothetical protein
MLAWLTRTVFPWGSIASIGLAGRSELHTTIMPFILRGVSLLGISSVDRPMPLRRRIFGSAWPPICAPGTSIRSSPERFPWMNYCLFLTECWQGLTESERW